ncbi:unnamed protein product [Arabidopsis lyrata]|uniref:Predicted protein n=1 Tax=Arabidopsis lyrata subsp. lyrata TaxID=81972 RepID=D7KNZ6_ARALL|nr:predicted protein [Arabidopsis lyrata subsp. lyrata]CAH8256810.1 unnamed protein product [Arabidopsis lyrata]
MFPIKGWALKRKGGKRKLTCCGAYSFGFSENRNLQRISCRERIGLHELVSCIRCRDIGSRSCNGRMKKEIGIEYEVQSVRAPQVTPITTCHGRSGLNWVPRSRASVTGLSLHDGPGHGH